MHELGIAQSILDAALGEAKAAGGDHVHVVRLRLGRLAGVVAEALQFSFEVIREGTPAADAVLEIEEVPVRLKCGSCGREFVLPEDLVFHCPGCGAGNAQLLSGREIEIGSLEIS